MFASFLVGVGGRAFPNHIRAPKKHISKNKDRDIPYTSPYIEAQ